MHLIRILKLQSSWRRRNYRKSRNKLQSWISTDLESLCLESELGPSTRRSYSFESPLVDIHVQSWYVQEGALGYAREIRQLAGLSRAAGHESWRRSSARALLHYASHEQKGSGLNSLLLTISGIVSGQPVHILIKPDLRWMGHTTSWTYDTLAGGSWSSF